MSPTRINAGSGLRLLVLGLIWGTSFLWMKLALADCSPAVIASVRCALGAVVLAVFLAARRPPLPRDVRVWGHLAVVAATGMALPFTCFALAERTTSTGLTGALNSTTPLFTAVLSLLFLRGRNHMNLRKGIGLVIGFGGAVIMLRPWNEHASIGGALLCLLAAASYGVTFVYQTHFLMGRFPVTVLAGIQLALAAPLAALGIPFAGPTHAPSLQVALALLILGAACTGIAQILNYQIIASDGPVVASSVTYLVPVFAIVIGALFLHEQVAWTTYVGAAAALFGVLLSRR